MTAHTNSPWRPQSPLRELRQGYNLCTVLQAHRESDRKIALVVDVVGVGGLHGLNLLRVNNNLDVGLRRGPALDVPTQHAALRGSRLPAARAKHDPVHR